MVKMENLFNYSIMHQYDEVGLRLLVPYQGADGLDALGDVGGGVAVVVCAHHDYHDLQNGPD